MNLVKLKQRLHIAHDVNPLTSFELRSESTYSFSTYVFCIRSRNLRYFSDRFKFTIHLFTHLRSPFLSEGRCLASYCWHI